MTTPRAEVRRRILSAAAELGRTDARTSRAPLDRDHSARYIAERAAAGCGFGSSALRCVDPLLVLAAYRGAYVEVATA